MRLLLTLCCLLTSAWTYSIDQNHASMNEKPLEDWDTEYDLPSEDVAEVAKIIAENKQKTRNRLMREHTAIYEQNNLVINKAKEYVQELKKSMRPIPGGLPPSITEINMRNGGDELLIEGDIIMTPAQARHYFRVDTEGRRSKRQAYQEKGKFPKTLWSQGVFYMFNETLSKEGQDVVDAAVAFWQANTCISFTKTDDPDNAPVKPVLEFYAGTKCNSKIGRFILMDLDGNDVIPDKQRVSIGPGCETFHTATHEIGHALGFMHEQSRWDRDEYLTLDLTKVVNSSLHNYNKYEKEENDNYGKQYDYGGNMHYSDNSFAKNPNDTVMYAKNPAYQMSIGGAVGPVYGDVYEMNMQYKCYEKCKTSATKCLYEGKPNPNKCNECQCPSGFGGKDCSERQAPSHGLNCGDTLEAGADWTAVTSMRTIGAGNTDSSKGNETDPYHCTWHITAPAGKVIEYMVNYVRRTGNAEDKFCTPNCYFGGVKIKGLEKTWIPEGMKFCCKQQFNQTMTTASNLLIIQPYNHFVYTDFSVQYKLKDDGPVTNSSSSSSTSSSTTTSTTSSTTPSTTSSTSSSSSTSSTTTTAAPTNSSSTSSSTTSSTTPSTTSSTTPSTTTTTEKPVKVQHFGKYTLVMTRMSFNDAEAYCATEGRRLVVFHNKDKANEKTISRVLNIVDKDAAGIYWIGMKKAAGKESPFQWIDSSPIDYENWPKRKPKPTAKEQCVLHWDTNWSASNCAFKYASVCH